VPYSILRLSSRQAQPVERNVAFPRLSQLVVEVVNS